MTIARQKAPRNSSDIDRHSIIAIYMAMNWTVSYLDPNVEREIAELPNDMQAKLRRIADMIEQLGLAAMREPYVKHLQGKLWEMRMVGRDGIARAIYVTMSAQRVVIVRVFRKKTQKTPRCEIELALKRAEQVK
jgi:phage-related protein